MLEFVVAAALALALVAGCSKSGPDMAQRVIQVPSAGATVETVNGTAVPKSLLEAYARQHHMDLKDPAQRSRALESLTNFVLMAQEARRQGWLTDPGIRADAELARLQSVADGAFRKLGEQTAISDSMLKAEYDAEIKRSGRVAYDFTQLLFDNQNDALKAEGEILSGKPFSKVYDEWHNKAKQARSFSRVRRDQVPPELANALAELSNGQTTKVPVKTKFGWHIVHLDIANPFTPPPFDQIKKGIRRTMQANVGRQRLAKLREQATVSYPPGGAPPPAASPNAPASAPDAAKPGLARPATPKPGGAAQH